MIKSKFFNFDINLMLQGLVGGSGLHSLHVQLRLAAALPLQTEQQLLKSLNPRLGIWTE